MKTSLNNHELSKYLKKQLGTFFPDNEHDIKSIDFLIKKTLKRLEFNFKHIKLNYFWKNNHIFFNHLNADQYVVFIYYASNIAFEYFKNEELASKLFYLNKVLHGFHCMYDTKLPDIFLVIHGNGIVLGKAKYSNYLVLMHGITVGSNSKWEAPSLGKRIVMYPNSSVLGKSEIADSTCISNGSLLIDFDTQRNSLIIGNSPNLIIKSQKECKSNIYFKDQI